MKEESIINIRKLAALDMALHGQTPITIEFIFGVFGLAAIGMLTYLSMGLIIGMYMTLISFNYIPVLIYAILIGNQKNAKKEVKVEMSNLKYYGRKYFFQQFMVFIPFSMVVLSILQEFKS